MTTNVIDKQNRILAKLTDDVAKGRYDGISLAVAYRGEEVYRADVGSDGHSRPLQDQTVFSLMSLTKGLLATLVFRLIEHGHFSLTTPLSQVIPELTGSAARINVYHVLTQTSGLPTNTPGIPAEVVADLEKYALSVASEPLAIEPGERVAYSIRVAHSVLGLFVQRIMDEDLVDLLDKVVLAPLQMCDTSIGLPESSAARSAKVKAAPYLNEAERQIVEENISFINDFSLRPDAVVPASNGFSTVADMQKLVEALRTGRTAAGDPFLSPATINLIAQNHTGDSPNDLGPALFSEKNLVTDYPANLALGFWGRGSTMTQSLFGHLCSPRTFGMVGRGSAVAWVDPALELSVVALSVGLMNESDNVLRFTALGDMIVSAVSSTYSVPSIGAEGDWR